MIVSIDYVEARESANRHNYVEDAGQYCVDVSSLWCSTREAYVILVKVYCDGNKIFACRKIIYNSADADNLVRCIIDYKVPEFISAHKLTKRMLREEIDTLE
jgi:hypothetical protein